MVKKLIHILLEPHFQMKLLRIRFGILLIWTKWQENNQDKKSGDIGNICKSNLQMYRFYALKSKKIIVTSPPYKLIKITDG